METSKFNKSFWKKVVVIFLALIVILAIVREITVGFLFNEISGSVKQMAEKNQRDFVQATNEMQQKQQQMQQDYLKNAKNQKQEMDNKLDQMKKDLDKFSVDNNLRSARVECSLHDKALADDEANFVATGKDPHSAKDLAVCVCKKLSALGPVSANCEKIVEAGGDNVSP